MEQKSDGPASLLHALTNWCDPLIVMRARQEQQAFTVVALQEAGRPNLGQARQTSSMFGRYIPSSLDDKTRRCELTWWALITHWRQQLEAEEISLTGVQVLPVSQKTRGPVPGVWATEFEFDFLTNTVDGMGHRYIAVQAHRGGMSDREAGASRLADQNASDFDTAQASLLAGGAIRKLSPETVAALLELHAEHVCTDLRVNLNQPGWASVVALAATKMKHRAERGELRPTLSEEAAWLSDWLKKVAASYDTPGEKRLSNKLGRLYRDLMAANGFPRSSPKR